MVAVVVASSQFYQHSINLIEHFLLCSIHNFQCCQCKKVFPFGFVFSPPIIFVSNGKYFRCTHSIATMSNNCSRFFLSVALQIASYIREHFYFIFYVFLISPLDSVRCFGWNEHSGECKRGFRYCNLARACVSERDKKTSALETTTLYDLKKTAPTLIAFTQIMWNNHISYSYAMLCLVYSL